MGVIFKIKPDGTGYSKMLEFAGTTNGQSPEGDLIYDGTYLYGMTNTGGTNSDGVVFLSIHLLCNVSAATSQITM